MTLPNGYLKDLSACLGDRRVANTLFDVINTVDGDGSLTCSGLLVTTNSATPTVGTVDMAVTSTSAGFTVYGDANTYLSFNADATTCIMTFAGATTQAELRMAPGVVQALNITDQIGSLMTFNTSVGARVITIGGGVAADSVQVGGVASAKVGFFNTTPAVRQTAFTQTYSTATVTHSNPTATTLTAASGTSDGTVADVGGAFNQTTLNNNFQDVATAINALIVDVANAKQVLNKVIDYLQAYGLFA